MKTSRLSILFLLTVLLMPACKQKGSQNLSLIPEYNSLISAFTSGVISAESTVKIEFAQAFTDSVSPNSEVDEAVFSISPKVEGSLIYTSQQSMEFIPESGFLSGARYEVDLKLNKIFPNAGDTKQFNFTFNIIEQHMQIELAGFRPYNDYKPVQNYLSGTIITADVADPEAMEALITAVQEKNKLPIRWDHIGDGKIHEFTVDSIIRGEEESLVEINYDASLIHSEQKGTEEFIVPALGDFKVLNHQLVQYPEQHVLIRFSDPLRKNQYLDGLIRFSNNTDLRFIVEGNAIKAYPNVRQNGTLTVYVEPGIKNSAGKGLKKAEQMKVVFQEIKPSVQLLGNGVIVPTTDEVLLPFKAVNLKAVDVKVIRIYENNIAQFLQVNQLSGNSELKRAGRLIEKKTISLVADKPISYGQWNTFSLNLTELVKTEPGAIYRVELNFRQSQSLFPCAEDAEDKVAEEENFDFEEDQEMSYWDSYEGYYNNWDYYYYEGYSYRDREDPCKPAYYGKRRAVSRNVLASNLGLIAKYGSGQQLFVTVTDLNTASPLSNADVKVYNYQQQVLESGSTNGDGMVSFEMGSKPFLVIAEHNGQKAYLRLVDGSALSYSMFDVSGTVIKKGIKGFLYGDRGVWRPGDSLFMNLILDDQLNPLPDGHPVSFELKDPQGKLIQKRIVTDNGSGFFAFHTQTANDAPTGHYTLIAKVGGVSFSKMLQIETVKPNRLKIDLSFDSELLQPAKGAVNAHLFGKWLTGATARNLRAEVEVLFKPTSTTFKSFEGYTFTNPSMKLADYSTSFWSGNIDETGNADLSNSLDIVGDAPGMLKAIFTTRLFEKSGDFSIDQQVVDCSPYNTYVGIKLPPGDKRGMLLTDTAQTVKVATVNGDGEPVTKIGLDVKVYKLSWRWWWDASYENLASYVGSSYRTPVYSTTISTKSGHGSFDFRINYPEWGRYLVMVKDKGGHSAAKIVYIDWPGWAGRARKGDPNAASVLSFSADKTTYQVGETAEITIPSSEGGKILVSVENGTGILQQKWVETSGTDTKFNLKVTEDMTPNVYIYAALLQPHKNTANDLPIRMYGVIPIKVEDPETILYPELKMPDELSPKSKVKIEVSEKYNKEMTYTIAIVDEGLLDLTRFKTPNPWATFYAREAMGVKTWDMFEHVLGAFGGRIDGIYSIGGGFDEEGGDEAKDANRFPPMVKFIGPFKLQGKSNVHEILMPNYIGSVRTMIVAAKDGAYGHADKTTPVKQPLMLLATLPRVMGPGEEVSLPVNVFVMDEKIKNVNIEVQTNDLFSCDVKKQTVDFDGEGDEIVEFMLKTPEKTGVAKVKVLASSGKHKAEYEIELNVRSSNPAATNFLSAVVEASDVYEQEIEYIGMTGTNELTLEVSNIPPIDFGRRLKYLLKYPHGCIEQTTSAVFPQLFLGDVMELDEKVAAKTEANVKAGIHRLNSFQVSSGGFSYWPGAISENSWGTSYAGHFLLEAKEKGYDVPKALLSNWQRYQKKTARRWSLSGSTNQYEIRQEQMLQAYRLFTLALSGNAEMGSMNRLRERSDLIPEAKWRLAAAYALAGQKETAKDLITNVPTTVRDYNDSRYSFGSSTRDKAMILEAMILIGMKENGGMLLEQIAEKLSARHWMSTQTTAYSLIAVAKFTGGKASAERIDFQYAFNDAELIKAETGMPVAQLEFDPGETMKGKIKVKNNSDGILFVRVINTGLPAPGTEEAISQNLKVSVMCRDMEGNSLDPEDIEQGTDFIMKFKVTNPGTMGYLDNMALTCIFPSGWEIHNDRMFGTTNERQTFTYQDIRDDRVLTYFSLAGNKSKEFTLRLNAAYKGKFYMPSIHAEEMYKNSVQVLVPGKWIEVIAKE